MTAKDIRDMLCDKPFTPFRLVLTSGEHHDVVEPGLAALLKSEVFVAYPNSDCWALIPLRQIATLKAIRKRSAHKPARRRR